MFRWLLFIPVVGDIRKQDLRFLVCLGHRKYWQNLSFYLPWINSLVGLSKSNGGIITHSLMDLNCLLLYICIWLLNFRLAHCNHISALASNFNLLCKIFGKIQLLIDITNNYNFSKWCKFTCIPLKYFCFVFVGLPEQMWKTE